VLELTLIEAALRAGARDLAGQLTSERQAERAHSPLTGLFTERAASLAET